MATLSGFLNPKKIETVSFALSDRFVDENGEPLEWKIRCVSGDEIKTIQNACTKTIRTGNKTRTEFDTQKFQDCILAAAVVEPNPNAADLLDAYGVMSPEKIFGKMLTGAEYLKLFSEVSRINGLNEDFNSLVEEAKN